MFVFYIIFLIYFLCFSEWYGRTGDLGTYRYNLMPFKEIKRFWEYREVLGTFTVFANLFGNILIFVPYGFLISTFSRRGRINRSFLWSIILCTGVELFQLFTRVGSFDVDDIILNTLGGLLGWFLFKICNRIRRKIYVRNQEKAEG
ncbi:MAG: VanZ family protein [Schaedlerella sp.]|nr:VanZ family protein [Schaedlerella sp.]